LGPRTAGLLDPQILDEELEQPVEGQGRVEHVGARRARVEPLHERPEQRRLAGARLAREHHEALSPLNPVLELGQGLPVLGPAEEESRIRRRAERLA
jgi:hypothetical protein